MFYVTMFLYCFLWFYAFYIFPVYFDRFPTDAPLRKYKHNIHWRVSFYSPAILDWPRRNQYWVPSFVSNFA